MKRRLLFAFCLITLAISSVLAGGPGKPTNTLGIKSTKVYDKKFNWGLSLYAGYSNYGGKYEDSDSVDNECGYNFGFAADARYNISDRFAIVGRVRLIEYNGFAKKDESTATFGPYTTTSKYHSGIETHSVGIDFMADWNFLENTHLYGGPSITMNFLTNQRSWGTTTTTYNNTSTTTDFGDKKWDKVEDINRTSVGLTLGLMHDFEVGNMYISPFIDSTIPFTPSLTQDNPGSNNNYNVRITQLRFGARFQF